MPKTEAIQEYLKLYADDRLAALLAHAEDEKLAYCSCCCLVGAINAPHALRGRSESCFETHYLEAVNRPGAAEAGVQYSLLSPGWTKEDDAERCKVLIPLIRAEMDRRECERAVTPEPEAVNAIG